MRVCPFDGCCTMIPDDKFSCGPHWWGLTKEQRSEIWAAYRAYQALRLSIEELRAVQARVVTEVQAKGPLSE